MLKTLLALINGPASSDPLQDDDARTALTALLIRVAKSDDHYAQSEIDTIRGIIERHYGVTGAETDALMQEADELDAKAGDTVALTRIIKDGVPHDERIWVVEALWEVVLADKKRTDDENSLLRLVVSLIGITDLHSGLARQRVSANGAKPIR